jgi:hypothetical protein
MIAVPKNMTTFFASGSRQTFQGSATHVSELYSHEPVFEIATRQHPQSVSVSGSRASGATCILSSSDQDALQFSAVDPDLYQEIIKNVCAVSNPVMLESASKTLRKLRQEQAPMFMDPMLAAHVMVLMERFKYRLNARRFLYDMFDLAVFDEEGMHILDSFIAVRGSDLQSHLAQQQQKQETQQQMQQLTPQAYDPLRSPPAQFESSKTVLIEKAAAVDGTAEQETVNVAPESRLPPYIVQVTPASVVQPRASEIDVPVLSDPPQLQLRARDPRRRPAAHHRREQSEDFQQMPTPPQHESPLPK